MLIDKINHVNTIAYARVRGRGGEIALPVSPCGTAVAKMLGVLLSTDIFGQMADGPASRPAQDGTENGIKEVFRFRFNKV